jgi:threonylcarbamoyladenosine tRNA methylthiotransferase MtaB
LCILPKKYKVVALGCRTNQYEAQSFRDGLEQLGYVQAQDGELADLCIVNTCTVTESADSSSRHQIRQLAKNNPGCQVVVTGCLAERNPASIASIKGVSHVVSNKDKEELLKIVFPDEENLPEFAINRFEAHTRAFLKVQDGCNSFCTYCIIPYVRGRSRSRSVDDILREAKRLIANGFKEIVLTGINIGDFDGKTDPAVRLATLVRQVDRLEGLERLRISSIDPDEVDDDLADAVLNGAHTCHSLHLVLQSGSNAVLKRMNRKYTRQIFYDTVRRLTEASGDFTFTTDVIVGFPGETEADFEQTQEVMREVQFAKVHMFPYSDRPRTRSATFPNKISPPEMNRRKAILLCLAEEMSYKMRNRFVGREMNILTESSDEEGFLTGHTENFLPVKIPKASYTSNEIISVLLSKNTPVGFIGKVVC